MSYEVHSQQMNKWPVLRLVFNYQGWTGYSIDRRRCGLHNMSMETGLCLSGLNCISRVALHTKPSCNQFRLQEATSCQHNALKLSRAKWENRRASVGRIYVKIHIFLKAVVLPKNIPNQMWVRLGFGGTSHITNNLWSFCGVSQDCSWVSVKSSSVLKVLTE